MLVHRLHAPVLECMSTTHVQRCHHKVTLISIIKSTAYLIRTAGMISKHRNMLAFLQVSGFSVSCLLFPRCQCCVPHVLASVPRASLVCVSWVFRPCLLLEFLCFVFFFAICLFVSCIFGFSASLKLTFVFNVPPSICTPFCYGTDIYSISDLVKQKK